MEPLIDKESLLVMFEKNDEAMAAYYILKETNIPVFVTGKAGSGKSTFIELAKTICPNKFSIIAPTGIAALNVNGRTIHSFFQLPQRFLLPSDSEIVNKFLDNAAKEKLEECELLIFDEISMVSSVMLDCINVILQKACNSKAPFAGKKVLIVGDPFQLPPIVNKADMPALLQNYKSEFFFHANVFQKTNPLKIEFKINYRQTDSNFIDILNSIRERCNLDRSISSINQKCFSWTLKKHLVTQQKFINLAFTNATADQINSAELNKLESLPFTFHADVKGDFDWSSVLALKTLTIKKGARIMFVKNNNMMPYCNGTMGFIQEIGDGKIVVVTDGGISFELEKEQWETEKLQRVNKDGKWVSEYTVIGSMEQYPIKLAWAITVHKSQGLTFDNVCIVNDRGSFSHGQTYVALSRCRTLDGLSLTNKLNNSDIIVDNHVVNFYKNIEDDRICDVLDDLIQEQTIEAENVS